MQISKLAKLSNLNAHTLRYYEKADLLTPSGRSENNYRIYSEDDLITVNLIKRGKKCGFNLLDVASQQLQHMPSRLTQLARYCCGSQESTEFFSITSTLESEI